jgi:hypothetical protein
LVPADWDLCDPKAEYGGTGLGGVLGSVLIVLVVLWLVAGLGEVSSNGD